MILESPLPESYAETILGSLQALRLKTDQEVLEDLSEVPRDSFFVQLIPYFPQCAKPGKSERSIAAQIRATLCDYVSSQGPNFMRVCVFVFCLSMTLLHTDSKLYFRLLLFVTVLCDILTPIWNTLYCSTTVY